MNDLYNGYYQAILSVYQGSLSQMCLALFGELKFRQSQEYESYPKQ